MDELRRKSRLGGGVTESHLPKPFECRFLPNSKLEWGESFRGGGFPSRFDPLPVSLGGRKVPDEPSWVACGCGGGVEKSHRSEDPEVRKVQA